MSLFGLDSGQLMCLGLAALVMTGNVLADRRKARIQATQSQ
jgi:hypothetical protein